jgi:hypothetical protein
MGVPVPQHNLPKQLIQELYTILYTCSFLIMETKRHLDERLPIDLLISLLCKTRTIKKGKKRTFLKL